MIPFDRIMQLLDVHFARGDLAGARRLLDYWLAEALQQGDVRGQIQIRNEQLGLYRRTGAQQDSMRTAEALLPLLDDSVWAATVLLNIATNYCHFGMPQSAEPLYPRVQAAYAALPPDDLRLAALHNNMAACAMARHDYARAYALYTQALQVQALTTPPVPDQAVTYVNRAMALYYASPLDDAVDTDMQAGYALLCMPHHVYDGDFAYVVQKVLPTYAHLGYKQQAAHLQRLLSLCQA